MNLVEKTFIGIIRNYINDVKIEEVSLSDEEIVDLLVLSWKQNLLPVIFDCLSNSKIPHMPDKNLMDLWQKRAINIVFRQIIQTNEFLNILLSCQNKGYDPVVVKGIICRNLYPSPFTRVSVDEDILVKKEDMKFIHETLLSEGLHADDENADIQNDYELSYHKKDSPTYIEVHSKLFDPAAEGYSSLNEFFGEELFDRTEKILIDDVYVRTLSFTDHFLFLVFHAYKHFIYSGVGIRAVCDIGMFADRYGDKIDWKYIRECLERVNVFYYAKALLNIIRQYLLTNSDFYKYIPDWNIEEVDINDMMNDILDSGALGDSSEDRLHTSNMTLHAVEGHKSNFVLNSLFPSVRKIKKSYPYLEKAPFLLPVAWIQRIIRYAKDSLSKNKSNATASVKLGMERIELLKEYKIIK